MFVSVFEQIISFLIDSMESLVDEFPVISWEPTLGIVLPCFFNHLPRIVKIKSIALYRVKDVLHLMDYQTVQVVKYTVGFLGWDLRLF